MQHTDAYLAQRASLNPKTVNNHLTLFISVLNAAVDLGWLAKVPRIKKPKVRLISADYRYLRTVEERDVFLRSAHAEGENVLPRAHLVKAATEDGRPAVPTIGTPPEVLAST